MSHFKNILELLELFIIFFKFVCLLFSILFWSNNDLVWLSVRRRVQHKTINRKIGIFSKFLQCFTRVGGNESFSWLILKIAKSGSKLRAKNFARRPV